MFPVLNVPLIHILLDKLSRAGCERIVVNCHHLAGQVEPAVAGRPGVILQHEPEILGTGGSLRKALPLFKEEPVLVMNGDIYHDIDVVSLMTSHLAADWSVTMAMHDYERFNSVEVRADRVYGFSPPAGSVIGDLLAFTGIHVLDKKVIERIPANRFFHIIDLYEQLAKEGQVGSVRVDGSLWHDIGTVADYLDLHRQLLCGRQASQARFNPEHQCWHISERATVAEDVVFSDWGVVGPGAQIGSGVRLGRCVVWENVRIGSGQQLNDKIVSQNVPRENDQ